MTGHHAIEGSGGAVIPAENGYLSVTAAGTGVTLVGRDVTGSEVWRQEQPFDLYSFRGGIGTADGGYLIAGSVAA
ncbi:hypothetical protein [Methanoculleus chikugoensis]|uniref:hypothetical protein n=1 Tax=Methanoculleus chikugoensis TaxID=118126 RepID=UPI0006D290C4|nr:hypothetical protein [Methanoculleus chikugoensis]